MYIYDLGSIHFIIEFQKHVYVYLFTSFWQIFIKLKIIYQLYSLLNKQTWSNNFFLQKIKIPFLEAVKITLGDRYTDYMATVYTITIDFVLDSLVEGYTDDTYVQIKLDNGQEIDVKENDKCLVKTAES